MSNSASLALNNVSKAYGLYSAVKNINLEFSSKELCLLVGPNGSGKSTILKLLAGLLSPDAGTVTASPEIAKSPIGYASHEPGLYGALSVKENLSLFSSLLGDSTPVSSLLSTWNLEGLSGRMLWELSKGQQSRVALARVFLGSARCVLLDEPTAFLDDTSTDSLCAFLNAQCKEQLVIIATHDVGRLTQLKPRVISLHNGEIV